MRFVLHVGMPKAGSTSIQMCLLRNVEALAAHGFSYLTEDPRVCSDYTLYDLAAGGRIVELGSLVDARVRAAATVGASTIIFSAERLFTLGLQERPLDELIRVLQERSDTLEIVIVVRPLVPFMNSYLRQLIDNGMFFVKDLDLARWCAATVRTFWNRPEPVTAISLDRAGRSLPSVFLDAIGAAIEVEVTRENVSSERSLAFHSASGLACRFFSLLRGSDVNSPEADELRLKLKRRYDETLAGDESGVALEAFEWLGSVISDSLDEYIASSLARVKPVDRLLIDQLTSSLISRNRETAN